MIIAEPDDVSLLKKQFQLGGQRVNQKQYYISQSKLTTYSLGGKRTSWDTYRLHLKFEPGKIDNKYTCIKYTYQHEDGPEINIGSLAGFSYVFKRDQTGEKDNEFMFGIDHSRFEGLVDDAGNKLDAERSYQVYNTFIDFHSFCNIFSQKTDSGKGIQDLKQIGQVIIHESAYTEAPVNVGTNVAKGSTFKNGKVTLELKGISLVDDSVCSLVGFDSGQSSFKMITEPVPNMKIITTGGSHYHGDIYIDNETNWVKKLIMDEWVVSETKIPHQQNKINAVTERHIIINNIKGLNSTAK